MSLRIGGIAAIIGAVLMTAALVVGSGLVGVTVEPVLGLAVMAVGSIVLLVALAGLSAFHARSHPRLAWAAFAVPALGEIGMIVGIAGMGIDDGPFWYVWFAGLMAFFIGSALFALATYRTGLLSWTAATLLGGGSVLPFVGGSCRPSGSHQGSRLVSSRSLLSASHWAGPRSGSTPSGSTASTARRGRPDRSARDHRASVYADEALTPRLVVHRLPSWMPRPSSTGWSVSG